MDSTATLLGETVNSRHCAVHVQQPPLSSVAVLGHGHQRHTFIHQPLRWHRRWQSRCQPSLCFCEI